MSFRSALLATALLAAANAHMIMESPVPFSVDKVDNGPIDDKQYPCKNTLGYTISKMNTMAVGEKQTLSFKGSAVHGGGSCQLSVTTDTEPTKDSVFKVIKTIEGGCPGVQAAEKFNFELPASIPNGKATFAWTWFAKLSGGPEMYMNCAPIEVTGGASDKSGFEALPDMLKANLASAKCKSPVSKVLKIPNPGKDYVSTGDAEPGTGDCGSSSGGSPPASPSSPAGQPSSPAGQPSPPAGQPTPPAGQPTPPAGQPTPPASKPSASPPSQAYPPTGGQSSVAAPPSAPSPPPSNPGGVFAPGAPGATSTTLVTVTGTPTPVKPTVPAGTGAPAQPTPPSTGGGSPPAAPGGSAPAAPGGSGSTCSTNGAIVCNGEKQFGLCNNGNIVWQEVASGTACVNGIISKRSMRIARPRYNRKG